VPQRLDGPDTTAQDQSAYSFIVSEAYFAALSTPATRPAAKEIREQSNPTTPQTNKNTEPEDAE
jgi:hypothetical protein